MSEPEKHIVIALPSYTGSMKTMTMNAILAEVVAISERGWSFQVLALVGDSLVARARNSLVAEFLDDTNGTDLIFIDDDVAWEPGAIVRLCEHPVDLVGGAYRVRSDPERYVVSFLDSKFLPVDPKTGLLEVATLMGGFTRITRAGLENFREECVKYIGPDGRQCHAMFDCGVYNSQYWGEDTTFCRRWRDAGGKVWIDAEIPLKHIGDKIFEGNFGDWLRRNAEAQTGKTMAELEAEFKTEQLEAAE